MFNLSGETKEKYRNIYCNELEEIIQKKDDNYEIIDVRTPGEFHSGHIPDAKLLNLMDPAFRNKIMDLDPGKTYYVYCRSGSRSMTACRIMSAAGFNHLFNVKFGLMGWQGPLNGKD